MSQVGISRACRSLAARLSELGEKSMLPFTAIYFRLPVAADFERAAESTKILIRKSNKRS